MHALVGSSSPDCEKCPSYCCYALSRPSDGGFSDPSNSPRPCKHLDVCQTCSCKIHSLLSNQSRTCSSYSCFWAGNIIQQTFWEQIQGYASVVSQKAFRDIERMCKYVGLFRDFVESEKWKCRNILVKLQKKVIEIAQIMAQRDNWDGLLESFYELLNGSMRERGIGIMTYPRTWEKVFVFLGQ